MFNSSCKLFCGYIVVNRGLSLSLGLSESLSPSVNLFSYFWNCLEPRGCHFLLICCWQQLLVGESEQIVRMLGAGVHGMLWRRCNQASCRPSLLLI